MRKWKWGIVRNTTYVKEKLTDNFTALKIHRQCPLVLLVIAGWKLGKELRSDGFKAKGRLCF
jgi:hypothetical protein